MFLKQRILATIVYAEQDPNSCKHTSKPVEILALNAMIHNIYPNSWRGCATIYKVTEL